jgi:uncharacterized protein YuzE
MRLSYDLNVRALYISLSDQAVARTQEIDDNTNVDLDARGAVVGIEVISIDHPWPLADILARYDIPAGERAQFGAYFPHAVTPAAPKIRIVSPAPAAALAAAQAA